MAKTWTFPKVTRLNPNSWLLAPHATHMRRDIHCRTLDLFVTRCLIGSDDAQGERLEVLWDAEIGAKLLGEDGWENVGQGLISMRRATDEGRS